jgi:hypothetical protein
MKLQSPPIVIRTFYKGYYLWFWVLVFRTLACLYANLTVIARKPIIPIAVKIIFLPSFP